MQNDITHLVRSAHLARVDRANKLRHFKCDLAFLGIVFMAVVSVFCIGATIATLPDGPIQDFAIMAVVLVLAWFIWSLIHLLTHD